MRNTTPNELMMLGTGILMIGLVLGSYSVSTYLEVKDLEKAVDFELIDDNNELSSEEKYYKYVEIGDFLSRKLTKNKDLAIKNSSCIYLDYAQHNTVELYRLTSRKLNTDETKKSVAAGNVRALYNMIDNYATCKNAPKYKHDLKNILADIENADKANVNLERTNRYIKEYNERKAKELMEKQTANTEEALPKLEPIADVQVVNPENLPAKESNSHTPVINEEKTNEVTQNSKE